MFSLRKTKHQPDLLDSRLFNERKFFAQMSKDIKTARSRILIESPFITVRRAREISALLEKTVSSGVRVKIRTRNPNHHDSVLKSQSIQGIEILKKSGAKVTTHNDMRHMKVAIIDEEILWEGSLNMLSHSNTKEIMRRSVSKDLCKQMLLYLS